MMEVEAKLRLHDAAGLRARLRDLGATDGGPAQQSDVLFSHPCRDLRATDEAVRVRMASGAWELTYKGPRQDGAVKARREVNVACAQDPTPLLEALGFRAAVAVRKLRSTWRLGHVAIAIDDVQGLGVFAEVEVLATDAEAGARDVEQALAQLGLKDAPREQRSYAEMLARR